jgi:transposase-like protein
MQDTKNIEWLLSQPKEYQLNLFRDYVELVKILASHLMEEEMDNKCGERYNRESPHSGRYDRWGSNPGSIKVGTEKVPIEVPRYHDKHESTKRNVGVYNEIKDQTSPTEKLLRSILLGLSQKDYGEVTKTISESFGLSQSTTSRKFIEESSASLEKYEKRDLGNYDFVGLMLDGKYLAREQIVICMGITMQGDKLLLGFIQTASENTKAVKGLLKNLLDRNLKYEEGLLCVVDGSKGLSKAVREIFGKHSMIQRCCWHKRENVISYLNENDALIFKSRLQSAYKEPTYEGAKARLMEIKNDLLKINRSAANSLQEGLEETLTLHRLGLSVELGRSLSTTNCIENVNSKLSGYLRRIKYWKNPDMLARWVAMGLIEIESRMRKISNHKKLYLLRDALKTELKLNNKLVA